MSTTYYVYLLANKRNGTFYVGMTANLLQRIYQHKEKLVDGFTQRYAVDTLVYYELYTDVNEAIAREKRVKKWKRAWKINLIEQDNPEWSDLYDSLV